VGITPREKTCHSRILLKDQDYKGYRKAPHLSRSSQNKAAHRPSVHTKEAQNFQGCLWTTISSNGTKPGNTRIQPRRKNGSLGCAGRDEGQLPSVLDKTLGRTQEQKPPRGRDSVPMVPRCQWPEKSPVLHQLSRAQST
jgi:hypothetical protein